jgi:medium-chain acyl-[acyl-carrier-protein] hydrolase
MAGRVASTRRLPVEGFPPQLDGAPPYIKWTNGTPVERYRNTRLRLFCFPYAGGGASIFREWPAELPPGIQVCPVQLPGRESRWGEAPFTRLSSLVETLANVLHPLLNVPFALFGHSMGALISFELARRLRRDTGEVPVHVFVSAARAPQIPDPWPPIHQLPDSEFANQLVRFNGIPAEVLQNAELMRMVLPTLRADFTLYETYVHQPEEPLSCPLSAYGGRQDSRVPAVHVAGWRAQTRGAFAFRGFPGDHFFLFNARRQLLRDLSAELSGILMRMSG